MDIKNSRGKSVSINTDKALGSLCYKIKYNSKLQAHLHIFQFICINITR